MMRGALSRCCRQQSQRLLQPGSDTVLRLCRVCRYLWGLLGVTGTAYAGTAGLTAVLFYFFNSTSQDCSFNVTVIVGTLMLGLVMSAISVSVLVRTWLLMLCRLCLVQRNNPPQALMAPECSASSPVPGKRCGRKRVQIPC